MTSSCKREGCAGQPPALPFTDGAGHYCSQSCAAGHEPLTDQYSRDRHGTFDAITLRDLAESTSLPISDAATAALVLRFAGIPVLVDGIGVSDDLITFGEYAERALELHDRHAKGPLSTIATWSAARKAGRALRDVLDVDWSAATDHEELSAA